MRVDEERTKAARERHQRGVRLLNLLFRADPAKVGTPQDQRWLSRSKSSRLLYRRYRDKTDPEWVGRRRRRKAQAAARRRNRG